MNNRHIVLSILSIFFCVAGAAQGQVQTVPLDWHDAGGHKIIFTPEQQAKEDQKWKLDQVAVAAMDAGQYAEAEDAARQSMDVGQDSGLALEILAAALNSQGKNKEAIQAYKTIADQGGIFPRNLVPYALLLLKSGQSGQAAAVYNQVRPELGKEPLARMGSSFSLDAMPPQDLEISLHIAQGITYNGDPGWGKHSRGEEGMTEFIKALKLAPDSPLANYYYGYGWQKLSPAERAKLAAKPGQREAVKAALEKAAKLGAPDVSAAAKVELKQLR